MTRNRTARVPEHADPIVQFALQAIIAIGEPEPFMLIETRAGVGADTVRRWLYCPHRRGPGIVALRRVLRALGFDLAVVRLPGGPEWGSLS